MTTDDSIALYVGRLERSKGVLVLLQAAGFVRHHVPHVQFVLAGASHPTLPPAELERVVRTSSLQSAVRLLGHVPHSQLPAWYRRATVCVLPSYYETFGLAALESMAWGVPVVATRTGGLPEVVLDGVTGLLVAPGDCLALAEAILRLLQDPALRSRLGRQAQEWATSHFDVRPHLEANLEAYRRAIGSRLRAPAAAPGTAVRNTIWSGKCT